MQNYITMQILKFLDPLWYCEKIVALNARHCSKISWLTDYCSWKWQHIHTHAHIQNVLDNIDRTNCVCVCACVCCAIAVVVKIITRLDKRKKLDDWLIMFFVNFLYCSLVVVVVAAADIVVAVYVLLAKGHVNNA